VGETFLRNEQLTILCGSIFEPGGSDLIHSRITSQLEL
jgi:hypothetical protein